MTKNNKSSEVSKKEYPRYFILSNNKYPSSLLYYKVNNYNDIRWKHKTSERLNKSIDFCHVLELESSKKLREVSASELALIV